MPGLTLPLEHVWRYETYPGRVLVYTQTSQGGVHLVAESAKDIDALIGALQQAKRKLERDQHPNGTDDCPSALCQGECMEVEPRADILPLPGEAQRYAPYDDEGVV